MAKNGPWQCSCQRYFQSYGAAVQHVADAHSKNGKRYGIYRRVSTMTADDAKAAMDEPLLSRGNEPWECVK